MYKICCMWRERRLDWKMPSSGSVRSMSFLMRLVTSISYLLAFAKFFCYVIEELPPVMDCLGLGSC